MTIEVAVDTDPPGVAFDAATLVAAAFPVPFLEMNAPFLAWALGARFDDGRPALAATARDDGRLVGFIGAVPRPLAFDGTHETGYIASFLASAPDHRGGGLVTAYYGALLDYVAKLRAPVLTYTVEGSIGDLVTLAVYKRAGFTGRRLEPFVTWGALRGRGRPVTSQVALPPAPTLTLDRTPLLRAHLDADPRGSSELAGGARVTAAWRATAHGREPVLILEILPSPCDSVSLAAAVAEGFAAFPDHAKQMTVPAMPESGAATAEAAGLRRMAVAPYHPWIWTPDAAHPFLAAERTAHPIL